MTFALPVGPPSTHPTLLAALSNLTNEAAWSRFVNGYRPFILSRCEGMGLNRSDAEEVCAIVLAALVRSMPNFRYDPMKRFRGYLTTVVTHATRTYWATLNRCPGGTGSGGDRDFVPEAEARWARFADSVDDRVSQDLTHLTVVVERVRARVEPHTWQAYWLTAIEDVKPAVVASQLGLTAATVYMAKKRVGDMILEEASKIMPPE